MTFLTVLIEMPGKSNLNKERVLILFFILFDLFNFLLTVQGIQFTLISEYMAEGV